MYKDMDIKCLDIKYVCKCMMTLMRQVNNFQSTPTSPGRADAVLSLNQKIFSKKTGHGKANFV